MRKGVVVNVSVADRARLEAIVGDRNSPQKHVWPAQIVLLSAAGLGTVERMRRMALAGALHAAGRRGALARQDPAVAHPSIVAGDC